MFIIRALLAGSLLGSAIAQTAPPAAPARNEPQSVANEDSAKDPGRQETGTILVANCEGRNVETYARVYGTCQNGQFSGPDDTTGNISFGRCTPGGSFEAIDSVTAQKITGRCDSGLKR